MRGKKKRRNLFFLNAVLSLAYCVKQKQTLLFKEKKKKKKAKQMLPLEASLAMQCVHFDGMANVLKQASESV